MKIRQPIHILPTYANFAVIDTKRGEVVLNLCFAEGDPQNPTATVVHKVILQTMNFAQLIEAGQKALAKEDLRPTDA